MVQMESRSFPGTKLGIGLVLYLTAAASDIGMTVHGMEGILAAEGNPLMRATMSRFGVEAGLWIQKAAIGVVLVLIAIYGERAIRNRARWIWKVPSTRMAREWMRQKDRSWIAYIPLYAGAIGQALAAGSWVLVGILS